MDAPALRSSATLDAAFHPWVRRWFGARFPDGATPPQARGWPAIRAGRDTLIAAPTGSGKTLSAFLVCIDRLVRAWDAEGALPDATRVVYVSPLKALAVDIRENLAAPLAGIRALALEEGRAAPEIRVAVRSGDTSPAARAAMLRRPPHFLVTTPESLYLLLTAEKSRALLRGVETVIVDEIHAVARDKRGSHLALSLERLEHSCEARPQRIGLSATQRPVETLARLLVGAGRERSRLDGTPRCAVVDEGHRRALDLGLELPEGMGELEAVASAEQLGQVLDRIAALVRAHRTTLVFVNTRRLSERIAHLLAERLGPDRVAAHHGSLSKERRQRVEERLRAGDLDALVATASLELGIDVGPVELVCQIGSPRGLATFLQRVGRSGHSRSGTPKGRIFPLTRDELVECAALLRGVRAGRLDAIHPPEAPLDILAQQVVAACAAESAREDELFQLVRGAAPFADLRREDFDEVVAMLSEGIATGRGRRAAHLHRDQVHGVLRGRRGARLAALSSGGAIPDRADYRVVLDPDETFLGTVDEDWAVESMAGDVFLLGSTSWRIRRVEAGKVRVVDAGGAPPTVPFWLGEAPARSEELSREVSELRAAVGGFLARDEPGAARRWVESECGLGPAAAHELVTYLAAARTALGALPTQEEIVFERFFDEAGGMQLVVHAPWGGRINRGLGLALRKRFCRSFDFELQAAATDDAVVLSLGPQHSFPLEAVPRFLPPDRLEETLAQAVLLSPLFAARWRWNANRALAVLRMRGGRRNPYPIQRMESDDLLAAVFPRLAGCQENATGPIEIPDHPLVRQTLDDCLHEAMDAAGLRALLEGIASGAVTVRFVDSSEPSPLCHEILNARPYAFLDDAPLEERRTRAVVLRRGLPVEARELGRLDPAAVARVREEAQPDPRDPDELHDLLLNLVLLRPDPRWRPHFEALVAARRACALEVGAERWWCAVERRPFAAALHPHARFRPDVPPPAALASLRPSADEAAVKALGGHLEVTGPVTAEGLARRVGLSPADAEIALARLEAEGGVLRGRFDDECSEVGEQFCCRRLLARIHATTQDRLRREIEPVSAQDFLRFLLRWQHATPATRREGRRGTLAAIEQLQGFELAAGAWEESVLPARVADYRPEWLDALCLSGAVAWGRPSLRPGDSPGSAAPADCEGARGTSPPSRATPVSLFRREDLAWLLAAARGDARPGEPAEAAARDVLAQLRASGALFQADLAAATGHSPQAVERALWDLVGRGVVTADGFQALRALLGGRARRGRRRRARGAEAQGRWSLFPGAGLRGERAEPDALAEAVAAQLLARWGVVFRDVLARESLAVPWRDLLRALRRMEARGSARGGRFVSGFAGEQFALPGAVEALRRTRRLERRGEVVRLSAADPLNLIGILTPGPRVPASRALGVAYRDGLPLPPEETGLACASAAGSRAAPQRPPRVHR
jgi:ATP-dependent Lhr-like helicase